MRAGLLVVISVSAFSATTVAAQPLEIPIRNWQAPAFFHSASAREMKRAASVVETNAVSLAPDAASAPLSFVGVTPCRVIDTRGVSPPTPTYGSPSLVNGVGREFSVLGGGCGIPSGAGFVSLNATVTNTVGGGYLALWAGGGAAWAGNSTLNVASGDTLANGAVIPLSATGTISAMTGGTNLDLIIDVNGYYAPSSSVGGVYSAVINATGAISSQSPSGWITTTSRPATGFYSLTPAAGTFAAAPHCVCSSWNSVTNCSQNSGTSNVYVYETDNTGASKDFMFSLVCVKTQ